MTINWSPEAVPYVRASSWWTRSIQLVASWLKGSLAGLTSSLCMSSVMVCSPYTGVFSCERELFPTSIDG
jgi:hypothetical protein